MTVDERPHPQEFLARLKEEEAEKGRGRLKIFFGFSAGVGKTFSMLSAAAKLKESGLDVVIGYVETHGRQETAALLEGFEVLPRRAIAYKGGNLEEFDLDLALGRKPSLLIVDELAHTNVPGSRHTKRWQDVQELIEAGIDVYTTLNVQHIESLHDVVSQITGVLVQERVPDLVLDSALEIELVDLPPDELIQRLKEGKVYLPVRAEDALANFFRKGNLIALRELALRYTAQHVDMQMLRYRQSHMITATWPACERILVCVSASPLSIRLVRAARRMADALKAQWTVAYVETSGHGSLSEAAKTRLFRTLSLAEELGAQTVELSGEGIAREITEFARRNNFSKIVIGKPVLPRWRELLKGSVVDEIVRMSGAVDVYVISGDALEKEPGVGNYWNGPRSSRPSNYMKAIMVVAAATGIAALMRDHFELSNLVMVYILAVVLVSHSCGRGPSVLASVLSVAAFDFFFVPPFLTFAVSDTQYLLTFAVMLTIALVISTLTSRVRMQIDAARDKERRTAALYSLSRNLSSTLSPEDIIQVGLAHIAELFECSTAFIQFESGAAAKPIVHRPAGAAGLGVIDDGVAVWSYKNRQAAGLGTPTLPGSDARYLPLAGLGQVLGVLAVAPRDERRFQAPEQLHLLETFANQMAVACERASLSRENDEARLLVKTEQLRNSLLSSVSHDLRTPLATIAGAASSILEGSENLDIDDCKELAGEICEQSARLNRLVGNLLDMTRLQSGALVLNLQLHPVEELIGSALSVFSRELSNRKVHTQVAENLPLVKVDAALIQQVMLNLLENALKYTPAGSAIAVRSWYLPEGQPGGAQVIIAVEDEGPGVSSEAARLIFNKFYRAGATETGAAPVGQTGVGLGLSICAGIVDAHGGKIWVEPRPSGGASFQFSLPGSDDYSPTP